MLINNYEAFGVAPPTAVARTAAPAGESLWDQAVAFVSSVIPQHTIGAAALKGDYNLAAQRTVAAVSKAQPAAVPSVDTQAEQRLLGMNLGALGLGGSMLPIMIGGGIALYILFGRKRGGGRRR